jgi:hypothetical protein
MHSVRAFASACAAAPSAAGDLARQSWDEALRQQQDDGGVGGAVRPYVLSAVLRTASVWTQGAQRGALDPELAAWCEVNQLPSPGKTAPAGSRLPSPVARAFAGLPDRSQTILWHQGVERDDPALTGRLLGAESGEVSALTGRVRTERRNSYVRILQDGMRDDCRRFHQLVLAYADTRSVDVASELAPHVEHCVRCSGAIADLARMQRDCGTLLAEALLPWGGGAYAFNAETDQEIITFGAALPSSATSGLAASGVAANSAAAGGDPISEGPSPDPLSSNIPASEALATELWSTGSRGEGEHDTAARGWRRHVPAVRIRRPAFLGAVGTGAGAPTPGRRRADIVVRCAAVVGLAGIAAAFAFAFPSGEPQSKDSAPSAKVPPTSRAADPAPSKSKPKPSPSKSKKPPSKKPSKKPPPSAPPVANPVVEWLFDGVNGRVAPDTSGNNNDGRLFLASPANAFSGGALNLNGGQFVASNRPLLNTSGSFSVSARVKLNDTEDSQTVISQDGEEISGFALQFDEDEGQWEMALAEEDDDDSDTEEAVSDIEPQAGRWTQLTGVYDANAQQIRLYVDGVLGEVVDHESEFAAQGAFVVGRALSDGEFTQGVRGSIDDVRAFPRAISSAEAQALARDR